MEQRWPRRLFGTVTTNGTLLVNGKEYPILAKRRKLVGQEWDLEQKAKKYKTTRVVLKSLYKKQGGKCPFDGQPIDLYDTKIHVDHDHKTGKPRGLLHARCNLMLGHFEPYKDTVAAILEYLKNE
jgi:hypothetical protein